MDNTSWKPSKKKYGVAICNYKGNGEKTLPLHVGEPVHITEEYGSGSTAWYRGVSLKNKDKEGVFPACLIHIKQCDVEREGSSHDTMTPKEDIMAREVGYVLHEWNAIWKDLYVKNDNLFERIKNSMEELIHLRATLLDKKLTEEESRDIKSDIVSVIDWGNGQLDLDLVPRIDGEQVDADKCSLTQLYRVHVNSSKIALEPIRRRRKTARSCKGEVAMEAGLTTHHLLVSFRNFGCNVGDRTETLLSLHQNRENKLVCLTEKFLVRHSKQMVPEDLEKLYNYYGLFTDLSTDEIEKDLYLVAHIYRIGGMHGHKSPKLTYKRPWAVGVTALNLARLPSNFKDYEYQMKVTDCHDNEDSFATLHEQLIKKLTPAGSQVDNKGKQGPTLTISLQILHGDLSTVKKEEPMLFSKGVAQIQKLGFTEDLSPGEVRNDLYVTLKSAELDRGNKKSQKNVEVKVTVLNEKGKLIENCITYGCGESPASEYHSSVHYHSNKPEWNETIRISVPIDIFPGSHLCFELFHCSVSNTNKESRCPCGFAFVRVTNEAQIVIKDDLHELCVYKCDEKHQVNKQQYFQLPFLLDDLNDPHKIPHIPNKLVFKANERESLTISTLLCSGKFTQNGDLLGILNWKGEQFAGKLAENLDKLLKMQGDEIVKFLHDIMDALFDMLMDEKQFQKYSKKIFHCMVNIFTLIHHARFETFKPVLENYIADTFSATLVHKPLCDCFADLIDSVKITNTHLIQSFQVMDFIFRFVVQSRQLQRKDVYTRGSGDAAEFRDNIQKVFFSMGNLLSSTSDKLTGNQVELLHHLHLVYTPLMETLTEKDMAEFLQLTLQHMPDVTKIPEDMTRAKIELLQKTIATKLFKSDESRALLLPFCLEEVKKCYENKILMRVATDLLSDVMDAIFKMKQAYDNNCLIDVGTVGIKEDIQHIIQTIFDVVMETILHLRDTFQTKDSCDGELESLIYKRSMKRPRKLPVRSKTHTGFTMVNEAGLNRRQVTGLDALVVPGLPLNEGTAKPKSPRTTRRKISDSSQNRSTVSLVEWMKTRGNVKEPESDNMEEKQSARSSYDSTFERGENRKSEVDITISMERPMECGSMIACLMEMLRLMEKDHCEALLHVYHRGRELRQFLMNIIEVFQVLVDPKVFSPDWIVMRMVTNNVMFTSMAEFSEALENNFITGDKFDHNLWSSYFQLAVSFITQPSLQLDRYTEVKAQKLREKYQDMRVLMGVQVETLWYALKVHKTHFIPGMIGPFLELTLVPEVDVRKVTLPIIYDMIEWDQKRHDNFKQVEAALIERLDYFLTMKHLGDTQYKDLFMKILLERVQSEPALNDNGTQFIISVTHLLERLLDYRQVVDGEENRDKRMHCTFNILNFYKDEINREEMYIKYVNKLHDLHMVAGNHAEAGLTLQLYAKILTWSDNLLPEEMKYKQERERDRKEMLYTQIINCFDKGKVWEYALPLCKDLAEYYERNLDYKKLGEILKQQASFYGKILEGVPGDEQGEPNTVFPRQDPSYYRVSYYGQSFPAFVRNKQFIYRGDECLKLATIMNHLTAEFPAAQVMTKNEPPTDDIMKGDQQYIQICSVKPIPHDRPEFRGKEVPVEIRNFYNYNEVNTFQYDRPYHRGIKDNNNEIKTLCLERSKIKTTYKFPGILRWYEVTETEIEMLCPIRVAVDQLKLNNSDLQILITRCQLNPKLFFSQLEMKLSGTISANVGGGIAKYHEAFFTKEFETKHPEEAVFLDQMKFLLQEQVKFLTTGMQIHGRLVPEPLRPLHESLELEFKKMKKTVNEHGSPFNSQVSLRSLLPERPGTPGSSSGSERSSTLSQDDDTSNVLHPGDLPFNLAAQCKSRRSYVPFPEEGSSSIPPPVPSRPHSMLLSTHGFSQATGMMTHKIKTGSEPHIGPTPVTPNMSTAKLPSQASLLKQRRDTICVAGVGQPPPLPGRRRPSEGPHNSESGAQSVRPELDSPLSPTIPTFTLANGEPPELPAKLRDTTKQTIVNEVHTPVSSHRTDKPVPPLPPRKNSVDYGTSVNISRNNIESNIRPSMLNLPGAESNSRNSPVTIHRTIGEEAAPPPIPRRTDRKSPMTNPKVLEFKDNDVTKF